MWPTLRDLYLEAPLWQATVLAASAATVIVVFGSVVPSGGQAGTSLPAPPVPTGPGSYVSLFPATPPPVPVAAGAAGAAVAPQTMAAPPPPLLPMDRPELENVAPAAENGVPIRELTVPGVQVRAPATGLAPKPRGELEGVEMPARETRPGLAPGARPELDGVILDLSRDARSLKPRDLPVPQ